MYDVKFAGHTLDMDHMHRIDYVELSSTQVKLFYQNDAHPETWDLKATDDSDLFMHDLAAWIRMVKVDDRENGTWVSYSHIDRIEAHGQGSNIVFSETTRPFFVDKPICETADLINKQNSLLDSRPASFSHTQLLQVSSDGVRASRAAGVTDEDRRVWRSGIVGI